MNDAVVLMVTCEKFKQTWDPFFILLKKFWPECKYEIIMGTDKGEYVGIRTISLDNDYGWSNNFIKILQQIQASRIILFFDDFLPCAPFNNKRINELLQHSVEFDIGCLRLQPCPGPTAPWKHDESLGILQPRDPYRLSTQTAIWKKDTLLSLVIPNETPWQLEEIGTKRAAKNKEHFVSVKRGESPTPYINTAIIKGVWQDSAIQFLIENGISTKNITKVVNSSRSKGQVFKI